MKITAKRNLNWFCNLALYGIIPFLNMDFESTIGVKHSAAKLNGRMLQKISRINKKSPEFRIDFMAAYRYNLGT